MQPVTTPAFRTRHSEWRCCSAKRSKKMLITPGDIVIIFNEMRGMRVQTRSPSLGAASAHAGYAWPLHAIPFGWVWEWQPTPRLGPPGRVIAHLPPAGRFLHPDNAVGSNISKFLHDPRRPPNLDQAGRCGRTESEMSRGGA